jgi:hypothetical protein
MHIFAIQGDQVIRKLDTKISGKLQPATNLVIAGSHEGTHTIKGTCQTRLDGDIRLVRVQRKTKLVHASRHLETAMPAGDYSITTQRERGGDIDRAVED